MTFDTVIQHQAYLAARTGKAYTTADEISFIRDLARRRQTAVLHTLRALVSVRRWTGPGMQIEVAAVRQALDAALEGLG